MTFTVTIGVLAPGAGSPTGTVTFLNGTARLGTGKLRTVKGVTTATFSTSKLSAGSYSITAQYGGDENFTGSAAPALTQVVNDTGSTAASGPVTAATAASPTATPCLRATSTSGLTTDAALRALLLDGSDMTGKPRSLFEILITIVLPTDGGRVLRIRKATTPEPQHTEIYRLLKAPAEIIRPQRTWSTPRRLIVVTKNTAK